MRSNKRIEDRVREVTKDRVQETTKGQRIGDKGQSTRSNKRTKDRVREVTRGQRTEYEK